jgi:hypothetical protein
MGGLGNQLFQIYTTISYSIRTGKQFIFPYSEFLDIGKMRPTYWRTFFQKLLQYTNLNRNGPDDEIKQLPIYKEGVFEYNEIPDFSVHYILLYGYYQSYKYFENDFSTINSMIDLKEQKDSIREEFFKDTYNNDETHTISMHFRLGDYKEKTDCHPIISLEYYKKALTQIVTARNQGENVSDSFIIVYYLCEEEDKQYVLNMVNNLQEIFPKIEFIRVDNKYQDWQQLLIMSCCHDNIIANSTFSWWGAYFNENPDKIVCYPSVWFGPKIGTPNLNDLFPPTWHKIHI